MFVCFYYFYIPPSSSQNANVNFCIHTQYHTCMSTICSSDPHYLSTPRSFSLCFFLCYSNSGSHCVDGPLLSLCRPIHYHPWKSKSFPSKFKIILQKLSTKIMSSYGYLWTCVVPWLWIRKPTQIPNSPELTLRVPLPAVIRKCHQLSQVVNGIKK